MRRVNDTIEQIRWACRQAAVRNTGYREGGAEMADTMEGRRRPSAVDDEYRRLCRQRGVAPV